MFFGTRAILALMLVWMGSARAEFILPQNFTNSTAQKNALTEWIHTTVRETYCEGQIEMCDEEVLRLMEQKEMTAFLKLTHAQDKPKLDALIKFYCAGPVDMCSYATIEMMYRAPANKTDRPDADGSPR